MKTPLTGFVGFIGNKIFRNNICLSIVFFLFPNHKFDLNDRIYQQSENHFAGKFTSILILLAGLLSTGKARSSLSWQTKIESVLTTNENAAPACIDSKKLIGCC